MTAYPAEPDYPFWAGRLSQALAFVLGEGPFQVDAASADKSAREALDAYWTSLDQPWKQAA